MYTKSKISIAIGLSYLPQVFLLKYRMLDKKIIFIKFKIPNNCLSSVQSSKNVKRLEK